jgi:ABC-type transport system involved in multi-copper enzyme maturation permease subunit
MTSTLLLAAGAQPGVAFGSVFLSYIWLANLCVVWGIFEAMRRASWWHALVAAFLVVTVFHFAHGIYPL